jgi:hypothetical protein
MVSSLRVAATPAQWSAIGRAAIEKQLLSALRNMEFRPAE